jgi:phenylacetate-coenzyme A ligase PaaK-like adenylate-forming protein
MESLRKKRKEDSEFYRAWFEAHGVRPPETPEPKEE